MRMTDADREPERHRERQTEREITLHVLVGFAVTVKFRYRTVNICEEG